MKKILWAILIAYTMFFVQVSAVKAEKEAGKSASFQYVAENAAPSLVHEEERELKRAVMRRVFQKYNSPLVDEVDSFIEMCETYSLNCYLLPAISGVESTFGRHLKPGTYNAYGWGGGLIYFESWKDGIFNVGKALREKYFDRGAVDLDSVGKIYAANPEWSQKVRRFMREFEREEAEYRLYFSYRGVEL